MPNITKINSSRGIVSFDTKDLVEHNLIRWIRTSHKGVATQRIIDEKPFETVAARLFVDKYGDSQVKLADKLLHDGKNIVVYLRLAEQVSETKSKYYNQHPVQVVRKKLEQKRVDS